MNGHVNARAVVRAQTAVANGGSAFGVELIRKETIDTIFDDQGIITGVGMPHGIGYGLGIGMGGPKAWGAPEATKSCFWGGAGGSSINLDLTNRVCFSYVMNQMSNDMLGDVRARLLGMQLYRAIS